MNILTKQLISLFTGVGKEQLIFDFHEIGKEQLISLFTGVGKKAEEDQRSTWADLASNLAASILTLIGLVGIDGLSVGFC